MKVLFVSAEVVPFSKTGGLADVAYALPKALKALGVDVKIITSRNFHNKPLKIEEEFLLESEVSVGWRNQYMGLSKAVYDDLEYFFIDNEYYFKREGIYGHYDDGERYAFFCRGVLEALKHMDFTPDIIHINDWHTAMIPLMMKVHYPEEPLFTNIKTVFTIHNLKYQGTFDPNIMGELLSLPKDIFNTGAVEFYGQVSFMKSGINFSDAITTVSKTYADEIKEPHFGEKLHDLLNSHHDKLFGIVNGIDYDMYNPEKDPLIVENYSYKNSSKKSICKLDLQEKMGLSKTKAPLVAMITRLADQKGLDLVEHVIEEILGLDIQVVVLGTGDEKYENMLRHFGYHFDNLGIHIGFDEDLAHSIYAGADMFLMPSLFEPCGLSQLIAQRYGTVPIVRETGGLRDTVLAYNKFTDQGTGFSFGSYNAHEMLFAVKRAIDLYQDKKAWRRMVRRIMILDNSWDQSAKAYLDLYTKLISES